MNVDEARLNGYLSREFLLSKYFPEPPPNLKFPPKISFFIQKLHRLRILCTPSWDALLMKRSFPAHAIFLPWGS